jgi:uncharacterized protein involved in response to NO
VQCSGGSGVNITVMESECSQSVAHYIVIIIAASMIVVLYLIYIIKYIPSFLLHVAMQDDVLNACSNA